SIQRAAEFGGAVVASGMIATVKRADTERRIVETVPRENLWLAQTPQTFRKGILAEAYEAAARDGVAATDDSFLVERIGGTVVIVEESAANIKITTRDDLRLAEAIAREIDRQP
ncbi:MAG TPA: 2-C-methyl-D-erythritol 4-phosphate cytidylyltransferase, partial [Planctomycetota bacterium]|nr:2-C-methyl-D-erythritol 4-phosphate cytidylyltransferase [Planctomycetota bacterium]